MRSSGKFKVRISNGNHLGIAQAFYVYQHVENVQLNIRMAGKYVR